MPDATNSNAPRPPWKPTGSTWIGAGAVLVVLIVAATRAGIGGFLIILAIVALVTALYIVAGRGRSWLNVSRNAAGPIAAGALVALVLGGSLYALTSPDEARPTTVASVFVTDAVGSDVADAEALFEAKGLHVALQNSDGDVLTAADLGSWIVESQDPPAGQKVDPSSEITLTLRRIEPTPTLTSVATPSSTPTPTSTPTPVPTAAPTQTPLPVNQFVAPANPAPAASAPPAPAPAPPAPAPAPPAPATGLIVPGAFCPDSEVGHVGVAANGRSYTCGGKGADANGHYHWNS